MAGGISFFPLNPQYHRRTPPAQSPIPLKPAEPFLNVPSEQAISLPDDKHPKDLTPSFKDIYLRKREDLRKSAEGMEAILVRQVLKTMRSTIPLPEEEDDLFGSSSHATQMFVQMMDDEMAGKIANNAEFGIAEKIFKSNINQLTEEFAAQVAAGQQSAFGIPLRRR